MATPITPTPVLEGKDAADFLRELLKDQVIKVPLKNLPKLEQTRKKIRDSGKDNQE